MSAPAPLRDQTFLGHLIELRSRLLGCVAVILGLFLVLLPFGDALFDRVAGPLRSVLPAGATLIATAPASPFLVPMKLAFLVAVFLAIPFLLYQTWAFLAPGLYRHERRLLWPLLASSVALFYLGAAFAYFVVLPAIFGFLIGSAPASVVPMPDIGEYLAFVSAMFLAFGAAFEIPIATVLLVWAGVATPEGLRRARPYVIVGAFVLGAIFTPPDVISQCLLAVPMWLLYELGIACSVWFGRRRLTRPLESGPTF